MTSKAELQEQVEILQGELDTALNDLAELKATMAKKAKLAKEKAQKQADKIDEERRALYEEAKDAYTQAKAVANDIYVNYAAEDPSNLGIVSVAVRDEVMHALSAVFGDELG